MTEMEILHMAIDPAIAESAIRGLATAFGKTLTEFAIGFLGKAGEKMLDEAGNLTEAAQALVFSISQQYIENYTARHGILNVLGMGKPVSLDSVYTQVNCQPEIIRIHQSIEAQEEAFRSRQSKDNEQTIPGMKVANENQYLLVLGNPGTGKSTFLRKVGLEALKGEGTGEYQHSCIPILLELRKLRSETTNLEFLQQKIAEEFENCGLPAYQECTNKFLKQGKLLIILDGLDEVPTEKMSEITTAIKNLVDVYSNNRFIVSCRIAAYHHSLNFQRFTNVAIADFNDEQIQTLIHKWFESHSQPEWGQQCWEKLNSRDYAATKELTKTPLLLTLICILFRKRGEFPNKRATVYNEALWTLLSEWDASKEIIRQQSYKGLDTKCKEIMLAEIAYNNFIKDNLFFQQGEIAPQVEQILKEMLLNEKIIDGRAVLRAIEEQHGVLVGRTEDVYSFSHLTLQEFLTAKHIVDNNIDIEELITKYLCDHRWREVFLIFAGLRKSDDLLLKMEQQIQTYVATPKLQNLLIWVKQITNSSEGNFKPMGKRANAFANVTAIAVAVANIFDYFTTIAITNNNAFAFDYSFYNAFAFEIAIVYGNVNANINTQDYAIDKFVKYAQLLERFQIYKDVNFTEIIARLNQLKNQVPDDNKSDDVQRNFSQCLIKIWLEAFHLTPEIIDLSAEELNGLDNYFYANFLMIQCHEAAVRVSTHTWESIEQRMFLPKA